MDQKRTERFTLMLSPDELKSIENWAHEHRIRSLSEAVRRMIEQSISVSQVDSRIGS